MSESPLVSTEYLASHLHDNDLVIVDASVERSPDGRGWRATREEFENEGHIPGARYADLVHDFSDRDAALAFTRPGVAEIEAAIGNLGISSKSRVVVYDTGNGIWAARLWWVLRAYGHEAVWVLDGGFGKWKAEGRPVEFGATAFAPASFAARLNEDFFVDKAEVASIATGDAPDVLACTLRRPVFTGEEQNYARPGHIPRSINIPYVDLIDEATGVLKPAPALREALAPAAGSGKRVIFYCGGGITAAGNALALAVLGINNVAIYDGSLSEWSADASLPMQTGG